MLPPVKITVHLLTRPPSPPCFFKLFDSSRFLQLNKNTTLIQKTTLSPPTFHSWLLSIPFPSLQSSLFFILALLNPTFYHPFSHLSLMMYAKKCIVEKENASLHQMEHSLILVNAILVGNKQLLIMMIIPSFSLAFFPIVRLILLVQLLLLLCKKRKPKQIDLFLISAVGLIAVVDRATRHHRLRMIANVQRVFLIFLMSLSSHATENVRLDWIVQTLGSPRRINLLPQHHHRPKTMRIELGRSC